MYCTRLERLEPTPQKCLRSCESPQAHVTTHCSCMPTSSSEQPQKLPVPAWSAANHVLCISGISPLALPAQKVLQKTPCSHLNSLNNTLFCGELLWTSLRYAALTTLETCGAGRFSSQIQEGRTIPRQKSKHLLHSAELFLSFPLNCHSFMDFFPVAQD